MDQRRVTVIMAAYNREILIQPAIDSFLRQTYENTDLLICNDFSTDATEETILRYTKQYSNIGYIKNERNQGFIYIIP